MPTLNEEKYLEKCLKSIKEQTFQNFEVIVVDGKSKDKTLNITKKYTDKIIVTKKRGVGIARNTGAKVAKGDILLFVDADVFFLPDVFEKLYELLQKDKKIVYGSIANYFEGYDFESRFLNKIFFVLSYIISFGHRSSNIGFISASGLFVNRNIFLKSGGFKNIIVEDAELGLRLKYFGKKRIIYNSYTITSSRRFKKEGYLRTSLFWLKKYLLILIYKKYTSIKNYSFVR